MSGDLERVSRRVSQDGRRAVPARRPLGLARSPGEAEVETARDLSPIQSAASPRGLARALASSDQEARARAITRLQQDHGNAFVQRLVGSLGGGRAVQREGGEASPLLEMRPDEAEAKKKADEHLKLQLDPATIAAAIAQARPAFLPESPPPGATSVEEPQEQEPGPSKPKPGDVGDLFEAISKEPQVDRLVTTLKTKAVGRLHRDWGRLGTGEKVLVVATATLIAGGGLGGLLSSTEGRNLALEQLNGRILPVPGVRGLTMEVNTKGRNVMVGMHLDVGALLPESWGFGPSAPTPIGGPPGAR